MSLYCCFHRLSSPPLGHTMGTHKLQWHNGGVLPLFLQTARTHTLTQTHTHTRTNTPTLLAIFSRQKKKRQLIYLQLIVCVWGGWGGVGGQSGAEAEICCWAGLGQTLMYVCRFVCVCCLWWVETGVSLSETERSGFPQWMIPAIAASQHYSSISELCQHTPAEQQHSAGGEELTPRRSRGNTFTSALFFFKA